MKNTAQNPKIVWPNLVYLVLTPLGALIFAPIAVHYHGWDWRIFLFAFIYSSLTTFCITGGYHRLFSHLSYSAKSAVKFFYLLIGAGAFQGSALKWCTDHRRHHRLVDTEDDPYNINQGFFYAHMGWLVVEDNPKFRDLWAQDLLNDRLVFLQHKYYLPLAFFMGFGFPTLVGWAFGSALSGLVFAGAIRLVLTNHSTFFINSLCHYIGKQPYTDKVSARDSFVMAVLTNGEGYHNFHHKFQSDYRNGVKWHHWDPTKWIVSAMAWLGLADKLKRTPAPQVFLARIEMDEKRLLASGHSTEHLQYFRLKVEETQLKLKQLREDYQILKRNVQKETKNKVRQMRAELKTARREFNIAWAQWGAYTRRRRLAAA